MRDEQTDLSLDALGAIKAARAFMHDGNRELLAAWLGIGRRPVDLVLVTLCLAGFVANMTDEDNIDEIALDLMANGFHGSNDIP